MKTRKMLSFLLALLMLLSLTSTAFASENGQMSGNGEKTAAEDTAPFTFTLYSPYTNGLPLLGSTSAF